MQKYFGPYDVYVCVFFFIQQGSNFRNILFEVPSLWVASWGYTLHLFFTGDWKKTTLVSV